MGEQGAVFGVDLRAHRAAHGEQPSVRELYELQRADVGECRSLRGLPAGGVDEADLVFRCERNPGAGGGEVAADEGGSGGGKYAKFRCTGKKIIGEFKGRQIFVWHRIKTGM